MGPPPEKNPTNLLYESGFLDAAMQAFSKQKKRLSSRRALKRRLRIDSLSRHFHVLHMDRAALRIQGSGDLNLFPLIVFGSVLVVELIGDAVGALQDILVAFFDNCARERLRGILLLRIIL